MRLSSATNPAARGAAQKRWCGAQRSLCARVYAEVEERANVWWGWRYASHAAYAARSMLLQRHENAMSAIHVTRDTASEARTAARCACRLRVFLLLRSICARWVLRHSGAMRDGAAYAQRYARICRGGAQRAMMRRTFRAMQPASDARMLPRYYASDIYAMNAFARVINVVVTWGGVRAVCGTQQGGGEAWCMLRRQVQCMAVRAWNVV